MCVVITDAIHAVACREGGIPVFESRSVWVANLQQSIATELMHVTDFIAVGEGSMRRHGETAVLS